MGTENGTVPIRVVLYVVRLNISAKISDFFVPGCTAYFITTTKPREKYIYKVFPSDASRMEGSIKWIMQDICGEEIIFEGFEVMLKFLSMFQR